MLSEREKNDHAKRYVKYKGDGKKARARYTPEEEALIADYSYSAREISIILGRSLKAIEHKRSDMRNRKAYFEQNNG